MSSVERSDARAGELIERLLIDPEFRAEFRRDPAAACVAAGLPDLADELTGSAGSMDQLAVRESRSSLAGVVMAVAVEGISVAEAQALIQHGLTGAPRGGAKLLHGGALRGPLGHVHRAASPASLERELHGLRGGSPAHGAGAPLAHAEPAASAQAAAAAPATQGHSASSTPSASPAAQDPPAPSSPAAPPTAAQDHSAPSTPVAAPAAAGPPPPDPGAQPVRGGVVPAWPDEHPAGAGGAAAGPAGGMADAPAGGAGGAGGGATSGLGGATGAPSGVLDSPQLSAPPDAQAFLAGGGADPRLVAVLSSALANHSIGLGQVTTLTDPVPMQVVSIVSVDGQPVGPSNFAARDLVTELAALDPSLRPSEIGTPWPIHAPGFFTDSAHQGQLHLAFLPGSEGEAPPTPAAAPVEAPTAAAPPAEPATAAAAPANSAPAPATAPNPGQYVNPLPASAQIGRTDMGVDADLNPGDPIVAPGASRVLGITPNWYRGQPYVALQLLDGPMKGHNYYIAEQITPDVSVGQVVQQGQPIGHYAASGTGIEMGWAGPNWEQTLAQATSGYSEGEQTAAGDSFHQFLDGLRHGGTPAAGGSSEAASAAPAAPAASPAPPMSEATPRRPRVPPHLWPSRPRQPRAPPQRWPRRPRRHPRRRPHRQHPRRRPHRSACSSRAATPRCATPSSSSPRCNQARAPHSMDRPRDQIAAPQPSASQLPEQSAPGSTVDQASEQPAPAGVLDQAPAPAPPGGSISVSSSLLTPGQQKFAGRLAELTGLDPHVVAAWELAEESGSAAQGREAASNFNWLNIGYFDSGAGKIAFDRTFSDPVSAAEQSAKFLKGEWGGASASIRAILNSVGHSADEQMAAIANSDWASSHYGGGANLHGTYDELSDIHIEKSTVT